MRAKVSVTNFMILGFFPPPSTSLQAGVVSNSVINHQLLPDSLVPLLLGKKTLPNVNT